MTLTLIKVLYSKQKAKVIQYRDYKWFSNETFMNDLQYKLFQGKCNFGNLLFKGFIETVGATPFVYKRYVQVTQAPFIDKIFNKEIMKR